MQIKKSSLDKNHLHPSLSVYSKSKAVTNSHRQITNICTQMPHLLSVFCCFLRTNTVFRKNYLYGEGKTIHAETRMGERRVLWSFYSFTFTLKKKINNDK